MHRRTFLKQAGLGLSAALIPSFLQQCDKEPAKPNILFLFTDDQRFDTIRELGNEQIKTPNIDYLVTHGTSFINGYIMGGTSPAVCAPSRAMVMTGRSLFHVNKTGTWSYPIPEEHITLPEHLKNNGYRTFGTGKWHNGREAFARSFTDGAKIFFGGMDDHFETAVYDFDPDGEYPEEQQYVGEKHSTALFADAVTEFIVDYDDTRPFFAYVSFTAPHDPRIMPMEFRNMYDPEDIPVPDNFMPEHPFDNGELKIRDEQLEEWPRTEEAIQQHIADYYGMISHIDQHVGRIMETLWETGHLDNTIIVFAGDNGLALGQHGLMGKQNLYEHSIHVPLIFAGEGIPEREKREEFAYLQDIYPTICDLIDIPPPETVEGYSLRQVIREDTAGEREQMYYAYMAYQRAVRDGDLKLIEYAVDGNRHTQLFNLQADPWELNDLSDDPEHQQDVERLRQKMVALKDQFDDDYADFWDYMEFFEAAASNF